MTLRTDDDLAEALRLLAADEGVSQQEVIRRAVLDRAARAGHRDRVAKASVEVVSLRGGLYERLART
ncbi:MAG: ribbon-helix-helix protein, CopG family [Acidimicrobiia bacterium]